MKLEIYQVGKVPPLTVVECDKWDSAFVNNIPCLRCSDSSGIIAMFFLNSIAGFKEITGGDNE